MKKRKFPLLLTIGGLLLFTAFAVVITFQIGSHISADKCQEVATKIGELLPERKAGIPETYSNPNMPILEIDNADYVAMLEIPSLNVVLPVADKWKSDKYFNTPARFYGSAYNHTLIIGGKDYSHQFSFCDKIDNGTIINITDMTGTMFSYTVKTVERSENAAKNWLISNDYDLTLFCKDIYSSEYIAVRCAFIYK